MYRRYIKSIITIIIIISEKHWKTSFEKTVFSALASKLLKYWFDQQELIHGVFFACGIWCR